jgi:hypothetical protein
MIKKILDDKGLLMLFSVMLGVIVVLALRPTSINFLGNADNNQGTINVGVKTMKHHFGNDDSHTNSNNNNE